MIEFMLCPFCGSIEQEVRCNTDSRHYIFCHGCEALGPPCRSIQKAIAAWNERHHPYEAEISQLKKELAALRVEKIYKERSR